MDTRFIDALMVGVRSANRFTRILALQRCSALTTGARPPRRLLTRHYRVLLKRLKDHSVAETEACLKYRTTSGGKPRQFTPCMGTQSKSASTYATGLLEFFFRFDPKLRRLAIRRVKSRPKAVGLVLLFAGSHWQRADAKELFGTLRQASPAQQRALLNLATTLSDPLLRHHAKDLARLLKASSKRVAGLAAILLLRGYPAGAKVNAKEQTAALALLNRLLASQPKAVALGELERLGPRNLPLLKGLIRLLGAKDRGVADAAVLAIATIGPAARAAIKPLVARLARCTGSQAGLDAEASLRALEAMGPVARSQARRPVLRHIFRVPDSLGPGLRALAAMRARLGPALERRVCKLYWKHCGYLYHPKDGGQPPADSSCGVAWKHSYHRAKAFRRNCMRDYNLAYWRPTPGPRRSIR